MNAKIHATIIEPVTATYAAQKYRHQPKEHVVFKQHNKKQQSFATSFQTACDAYNNSIFPSGCYGKDAQQVVGNVSSFDQSS